MADRPWLEDASSRGPDVRARADRAVALWSRAESEQAAGDAEASHRTLERAHDLVTDLPAGHEEAHVRLLPLETLLGHRRDARVSRLLLLLSTLGVFTLLAWYFRWREDYGRFDPATD